MTRPELFQTVLSNGASPASLVDFHLGLGIVYCRGYMNCFFVFLFLFFCPLGKMSSAVYIRVSCLGKRSSVPVCWLHRGFKPKVKAEQQLHW